MAVTQVFWFDFVENVPWKAWAFSFATACSKVFVRLVVAYVCRWCFVNAKHWQPLVGCEAYLLIWQDGRERAIRASVRDGRCIFQWAIRPLRSYMAGMVTGSHFMDDILLRSCLKVCLSSKSFRNVCFFWSGSDCLVGDRDDSRFIFVAGVCVDGEYHLCWNRFCSFCGEIFGLSCLLRSRVWTRGVLNVTLCVGYTDGISIECWSGPVVAARGRRGLTPVWRWIP